MSGPHDVLTYDTDNAKLVTPSASTAGQSRTTRRQNCVQVPWPVFLPPMQDSDSRFSSEQRENYNKMPGGRQGTRCLPLVRKWLLQSWKVLFVLLPAVALVLLYNGYIVQQSETHLPQPLVPVHSDQGQNDFQADNSSQNAGINSTKSLSRFIVYSCNKITVCGGWADRQKGIVVTYLIALMMNRKFRIDMPRPCDLQFFLVPNEVDWLMRPGETKGHSIKEIEAIDGHGLNFVDKLLKKGDLSIPEMDADYVVITANMDSVNELKKHPLAKTVPLLSNETSVPEIYRKSLGKLFTLSSGLRKTLDVAMESRSPDTKLVCAQVRMGGAGKDYNDSESFNSMANVENLMDFLSRYNDSTKYRMYFSSDSQKVRTDID
ncbi:hypothetical protein C0Q70_15468 [Pomacea canaliculata]|uniref:Uncharacterized protein n=1 Tax=Pomacea canaliculata TaxID=400727 RepID=A0A2T7NUY7_POMCA|nr:hypothetical protein C0Q70_15468 [Pomacea canaliculata]